MAGFLVFVFVLMTGCADVMASVGTRVEYGSNSPNCRHVSYNVHHLYQTNKHCQDGIQTGCGGLKDLGVQFVVLQNKLQTVENRLNKLEENRTRTEECKNEALINGANPIRDSQLSASSTHPHCNVSRSRLFTRGTRTTENPHAGAWCANSHTSQQWIQVNFGRSTEITGIGTQGRQDAGQWVTSYTLMYLSKDTDVWKNYTEDQAVKTFGGNWNQNAVSKHYLKTPFVAVVVRLHPKTWNSYSSLRWELYGCYV